VKEIVIVITHGMGKGKCDGVETCLGEGLSKVLPGEPADQFGDAVDVIVEHVPSRCCLVFPNQQAVFYLELKGNKVPCDKVARTLRKYFPELLIMFL